MVGKESGKIQQGSKCEMLLEAAAYRRKPVLARYERNGPLGSRKGG